MILREWPRARSRAAEANDSECLPPVLSSFRSYLLLSVACTTVVSLDSSHLLISWHELWNDVWYGLQVFAIVSYSSTLEWKLEVNDSECIVAAIFWR